MAEDLDPLRTLACAFSVSSFAGLARELRSGRRMSKLAVLSTILNTGLVGGGIACYWLTYYRNEGTLYFMILVCLLAGMGGADLIEFGLAWLRNGGITIRIQRDANRDEEPSASDVPKR